jgi:hypothetical protein
MGNFWDDFWVRFGTTVLITPIAVAAWKLCEEVWHRRYNRWLRKVAARHAAAHGVRQAALALSVGDDIGASVRADLTARGLVDGKADIPVLSVHQREGFGPDDGQWYGFLERVKAEVRRVRGEGFARVHVYTRLPVALALMVGATLTNGPAAVVYHFQNGRYEPVGLVTFETTKL